jgi:phosphoglycolate phosphatase-like HAD superfamily hydrolase
MSRKIGSCALLSLSVATLLPFDQGIKEKLSTKTKLSAKKNSTAESFTSISDQKLNTAQAFQGIIHRPNFSSYVQQFITNCEIREIERMDEIKESINLDTLLIYDLDNTVFEPVGNYGSDQWFYYLSKVYQMDGFSIEESEEKALELWNHTQSHIKVKPVESCIPTFIKDQQSKGVKTIAVTARSPATADVTIKQLTSIDVTFQESSIKNGGSLKIDHPGLNGDVLFHDGVLFVGEKNSKGEALILLLKNLNYRPENVVFVDDRRRHLEAVEKQLIAKKIPYKGFRYGAADKKVHAFNDFTSEISDNRTAGLFYMGKVL